MSKHVRVGPQWEVGATGGFARDDDTAHQEIHITGDVSLFIKQYYQIRQNRTELRDFFPLLSGIADFIVSRVNRTDAQGWLSVETIVGADESTDRVTVNNDIWSNAVSVQALETALDAFTTDLEVRGRSSSLFRTRKRCSQ